MLQSTSSLLRGHKDTISSVRLHTHGNLLATASDDGTVRIWSLERLKAVSCITALPSKRAPTIASFAIDNEHILYVASGRRLLVFDRRCGSVVMKVAEATSSPMRGRISCIDATATELVVCDDSGHVSTLAAANAALIHRSVGGEAHSNIVSAVAWNPSSLTGAHAMFASAGMDGKVVLWDEHCCRRRVWDTMNADLFDNSDSAVPSGMSINPPMALDVQWLRTDNSASQCLVGALRNGYLWAGDAVSACMGAVETPLSALSCVTSWHNNGCSYAAAAGQGSRVLVYSVGCTGSGSQSQGESTCATTSAATKKKKKKVGMQHVSVDIKPLGQLECSMRAVNSIAFSASASLLFVAGTQNDVEVHACKFDRNSD